MQEMMPKQISTAVSDFALACAAFYVSFQLFMNYNGYGSIGMFLLASAASAGVLRFSMNHSEAMQIFRIHKFLSWLCAGAGLGILAYQFCVRYNSITNGYIVIAFSGMVTLTSVFQNKENKELFVQASSGLSLLTILLLSFYQENWYGVSAALVYILAGAIIGSDGAFLGVPRVDLLHYALVAGVLLFLRALS